MQMALIVFYTIGIYNWGWYQVVLYNNIYFILFVFIKCFINYIYKAFLCIILLIYNLIKKKSCLIILLFYIF